MNRRGAGKRGSARARFGSPVHGRIASLRRDRGLTQDQLADEVEVTHTAVSHWENGQRPDPKILPKLAKALGTTVEDLTEGDAEYTALREALAS